MTNILLKEFKLSASVLAYFFMAFGMMFFLPGYPILCGAFFVTLGIYQSFQYAREANDIVFSALLPISKKDVVKGKFFFSCIIELGSFLLMVIATLIRMTVLSDALPYVNNALMNANLFTLGAALLIFGLFNLVFLGGFFKTSYKLGKPFIIYIIIAFITIGILEALHYIPGLSALNAFGFDHIWLQLGLFGCGLLSYTVITLLSFKSACNNFEKIDL